MTRTRQTRNKCDQATDLAAIAAEIGADHLTPAHVAILKNAGTRRDGALWPLPDEAAIDAAELEAAITLMQSHDLIEEVEASAGDEVWRVDDAGRKVTLRISLSGRITMGVPFLDEPPRDGAEKPQDSRKRKRARGDRAANKLAARRARKRTKADIVLRLLRRPAGASIAQLTRATGWQAHSVRAALTGLRKKGHVIERATGKNGQAVYRIEAQS